MSGGSLEKVPQQGPRVKVYVLGEFSDWEDFGVGFLEFKHEFNAETEQTDDFLTVRSERKTYSHQPLYPKRDREWLLYSKLDISNDYEKQEGTIIRWRDGELREELAISFTDKDKCDEQWYESDSI